MPRFSHGMAVETVRLLSAVSLILLLAPSAVQAEPNPVTVHVVQPGETLSQIALAAGTDADTLASLNALDDPNAVRVGTALKLPSVAAPPPATTYTVSDGDTLWSIAQRLGTTSDALVAQNHLDDPDHL